MYYDTHWKRSDIARGQREKILASLPEDVTKEQLIELLVEARTALYPFAQVLGSLLADGMHTEVTSKLFPFEDEDPANRDKFVICEDGKFKYLNLSEATFHEHDYLTQDSITVNNGSALHDLFEVVYGHQSSPGAGHYCGSIYMGDIRHASDLVFGDKK